MFRSKYPVAWAFHRNTSRYPFNTLELQEPEGGLAPYKEYPGAPVFPLPPPRLPAIPFGELLNKRYSCRKFSNSEISLENISTLLFAAYGIQECIPLGLEEFWERSVPSGGGLYPLEFYLISRKLEGMEEAVYHYVPFPSPGFLEKIKKIELPKPLIQYLFLQQPYVADASVVVVVTAVVERQLKKYFDRGYRYMLYEAGHAFQNINLMCTALGLGSLNLGGFFDEDMIRLIGLDGDDEVPLYAMAIGVPDITGEKQRTPE
jgi:SagB-type dehydrogenase family enzyme